MGITSVLTIYWDILIRTHSILAAFIFYIAMPCMFMIRKGTMLHRQLGKYTFSLLFIFYMSGQLIVTYQSIFILPSSLLIRDNMLDVMFRDHYVVIMENMVGFTIAAIAFLAIRFPKNIFLQKTVIIITFLGSIGLAFAIFFVHAHQERLIILAILGLLIVMPDIICMIKNGKTYRHGYLQHAYYIISTFVFAAVFQEVTSSAPLILRCCLSIAGFLPVLYLYLSTPNKSLAAKRSINPMLGFFIAISYFACLVHGEYYHFRHDCLNPKIPKYPTLCYFMLK